MGCGISIPGKRSARETSSSPVQNEGTNVSGNTAVDDDVLKELYGEKMIYDKRSDTYFSEKDYVPEEGEQAGACKPFTGAIVEPSKHPPHNPAVPDENYELEYVYGYRTYDSRQNLYFTANGKITYCTASVGVILDPQDNTQKFFAGGHSTKNRTKRHHDNDIVCLSISPDRKYVATGQVGVKPVLNIWDAETGEFRCKYEMTEKNTRAIVCCSWSLDGRYVAFADKSEKYNVYVVESSTGKLVQSDSNKNQQISDIGWSKKPGDLSFAMCGVKNIGFWTIGGKIKKGTGHGARSFAALTYDTKGTCYAGSFAGEICIFPGSGMSKDVPVHKSSILTMCWSDNKLFTGSTDYTILIFDSAIKQINKIPMGSGPRSLDVHDDNILVGLRNGSICLVSQSQKQITDYFMKSHHDGEVWGLEVTEDGDVITTGDDNKVMVWKPNERKNKQIGVINEKAGPNIKLGASSMTSFPPNQCSRAVAVNPKTGEVALGLNDGDVQIRDLNNISSIKKTMKAADRWIEAIAYSPNGEYLAVGTHNSTIVVYTTDTYSQKGTLKGNSAAILSVDWSKDSRYIRTVSLSYEYLFYMVDGMKQDTSGASNTKGLEWTTQSCKFGWSVQGIFEDKADFSQVNGVAMSSDEKLIASGNDNSEVSIFRNPCLKGSKSKKLYGHSEHVVRVKFGLNDQYIFSVGGQDKTLMQWKKC